MLDIYIYNGNKNMTAIFGDCNSVASMVVVNHMVQYKGDSVQMI